MKKLMKNYTESYKNVILMEAPVSYINKQLEMYQKFYKLLSCVKIYSVFKIYKKSKVFLQIKSYKLSCLHQNFMKP